MKKDNLETWRTMCTVIEYPGASREKNVQWIKKKNIPAHKVERQRKFKITEIDKSIRSGEAAEKNTTDDDKYNGGFRHGN